MSGLLPLVAFVVGLVLVVVGVWMVSVPAALVVAGLELVLLTVGYSRGGDE